MLAACIPFAKLPEEDGIVRTPRVLSLFELSGRVVVWQGATRHTVNIEWRHNGENDDIRFTTPLGQTLAQLTRDAQGARLTTVDGQQLTLDEWERQMGIKLPLDELPAWLSGQAPSPESGWQVDYRNYQSQAADALPTLIEAKRDDIGLRLKVTEWLLAQ